MRAPRGRRCVPLSPKQRAFVEAYVESRDVREAAVKAGYANANQAYGIMNITQVDMAIRERTGKTA